MRKRILCFYSLEHRLQVMLDVGSSPGRSDLIHKGLPAKCSRGRYSPDLEFQPHAHTDAATAATFFISLSHGNVQMAEPSVAIGHASCSAVVAQSPVAAHGAPLRSVDGPQRLAISCSCSAMPLSALSIAVSAGSVVCNITVTLRTAEHSPSTFQYLQTCSAAVPDRQPGGISDRTASHLL